jgi:predicted molibdopterin-dependent oxidoreductase YjgC
LTGTRVEIIVDGASVEVDAGLTVASALLNAGITAFRTSVAGEPRAPLCGMGICYECRARIDGSDHQRSCLRVVSAGMRVETQR